ncbi:MAG: hypothetical protein WCP73_10670, partial [Eubacteriales bacterium]
KIQTKKERIKTLSHMEDIILAADLSGDDVAAVCTMLSDVDIAVLYNRHPHQAEDADCSDAQNLGRYLERYLQYMPEGRRKQIRETALHIDIH